MIEYEYRWYRALAHDLLDGLNEECRDGGWRVVGVAAVESGYVWFLLERETPDGEGR